MQLQARHDSRIMTNLGDCSSEIRLQRSARWRNEGEFLDVKLGLSARDSVGIAFKLVRHDPNDTQTIELNSE